MIKSITLTIFLCLSIISQLNAEEYSENINEDTEKSATENADNLSNEDASVDSSSEEEPNGKEESPTESDEQPVKSSSKYKTGADAGSEGEENFLGEIPTPKSPLQQTGSFQTSLYTGSASYNYPIEVPPGTTGLAPQISINYNSSSRKASWVGLGWSIGMSYVQRDVNYTPGNPDDDKFKLFLNGQSYDLIYNEAENRFHTKIESYLHILKMSGDAENARGEYWLVRSKDGTKYRFGFRQESENFCADRNYVVRWYLDEVEDTHSNYQ